MAFDEVKRRIGQFNSQHVLQLCIALDNLNYNNVDFWDEIQVYIMKHLHKYNGKELVRILDLLVPNVEDDLDDDDVVYLHKEIEKKQKLERSEREFLQRIINIIPIHVKDFYPSRLTRLAEVCVQRELGDDRFYKEFLFFYVEKKIKMFSIDNYCRILRVLGTKQYTDDIIFWNSFIFPRIYLFPLNKSDAHQVWESLVALKMKCQDLDCTIPINYIESLLKKFELIDGYEQLTPEQQNKIKDVGELPIGVKKTIMHTNSLDMSKKAMQEAQQQLISESQHEQRLSKEQDEEYLKKKEKENREGSRGNKERGIKKKEEMCFMIQIN
eukprot:CAMPEP_0197003280 /NCGR_PEP_ID=MMETSP1380-20130617/7593_1 /TAXON_ID=5936 /ORGANISM="Euplotes crassus, Strain CT5" /LENGTH=325 /DNA_ID=CAMNT_0042421737 /DNA_START=362 /DNA_END=1337 /DNA_ORIENTATION=+